jgi:hypothetical protein
VSMKRIILHWTAGAYGVNNVEADAYHFIVNRDGSFTAGLDKPEDNIPPLRPGAYAAHTLNLNSHSIGIAVDAMAGARERPLHTGPSPITPEQLDGLVGLTARLCMKYGIPVTRETVLSHAEVQRTLVVKQRPKWDITWLPGMQATGDAIEIGDVLRARVRTAIAQRELLERKTTIAAATGKPQASPRIGWGQSIAAIFAGIIHLFKGGRT